MENEMSDTKFTKGEWSILPIEEDKEYIRIRGTLLGGRYKIANVIDLKGHHNGMSWCARERAESMANARLVKASPKMYKILESIYESARYAGTCSSEVDEIKAILDEVRGES